MVKRTNPPGFVDWLAGFGQRSIASGPWAPQLLESFEIANHGVAWVHARARFQREGLLICDCVFAHLDDHFIKFACEIRETVCQERLRLVAKQDYDAAVAGTVTWPLRTTLSQSVLLSALVRSQRGEFVGSLQSSFMPMAEAQYLLNAVGLELVESDISPLQKAGLIVADTGLGWGTVSVMPGSSRAQSSRETSISICASQTSPGEDLSPGLTYWYNNY